MVEIEVDYLGELRTSVVHGPSGASMSTDAPKDNQGRGEAFSPTDLVAAALGSCVATLIGIYAKRHDLDVAGMRVRVEKHMIAEPRRIGRLPVVVDVPIALDERHRQGIETVARHCPVHQSLHPDIDSPIEFRYAPG
jgi:putative redox protein